MKYLSRNRYALMTFPLAGVFGDGVMPVSETIRLTEQAGLSYVDLFYVQDKDVALRSADEVPPRPFPYETAADGRVMEVVVHGEGDIPIAELCERMEKDGYRGLYAIEYVPPKDNPGDFGANLEQIEKFLALTEDKENGCTCHSN